MEEERKEEEQAALCSGVHLLVVMTPTALWGTQLTIPDLDFRVRKEPGSSKSQHYVDVVPNRWNVELAGAQALVSEMDTTDLDAPCAILRHHRLHSSKSLFP